MRIILTFLLVVVLMSSCKLNRYKQGVRVGKWVTEYVTEGVAYKRVEYYKIGKEKRTWKMYNNHRLVTTEKYKNDTCYTKFYYPDGKISAIGKSVTDNEVTGTVHWYYIGPWKYYDSTGKLEVIRVYKKDDLNPQETILK